MTMLVNFGLVLLVLLLMTLFWAEVTHAVLKHPRREIYPRIFGAFPSAVIWTSLIFIAVIAVSPGGLTTLNQQIEEIKAAFTTAGGGQP